ncbi:hypothetical protein C9I28_07095 [Pseudoduganella armeniaca]|uniref:Uncharacterized protein n=1 Tax=Pseudoduganella armeniaca TaxID=2072590 RepID=A0A2R4C7I9_9BURK|nr:hypothetical protein C9I28_07095 [Pseudoduganella armeniaca]
MLQERTDGATEKQARSRECLWQIKEWNQVSAAELARSVRERTLIRPACRPYWGITEVLSDRSDSVTGALTVESRQPG